MSNASRSCTALLLAAPLLIPARAVSAAGPDTAHDLYAEGDYSSAEIKALPLDRQGREKYRAGWSLYIDNDALTPINRDEDYTGGMALTFAGQRAREWWVSTDAALGWIDGFAGLGSASIAAPLFTLHSIQFGTVAFTPADKSADLRATDDRPYASLVYVANARNYLNDERDGVFQTTLTVGVLGLDVARELQNGVHKTLGIGTAHNWDDQISNGGEPTLRYTLARQDLLASAIGTDSHGYEIKTSLAGSIGYITDASAALSLRAGRINTPWWSIPPERAEYIAEPAPVISGLRNDVREIYLTAGIKVRARAYNAFLQGQFRDNEFDYDYSQTRPLLGEAWAGITAQVGRHTRISWLLRYQSSELREGIGDRELVWGSLFINRDI